MAKPYQEAIETFMSITGVSEAIAIRKLEAHNGNLNEAVNAHFIEGDRNITQDASLAVPLDDFMDIDSPTADEFHRPSSSLFPLTGVNPFPLFKPNFSGSIFDWTTGIPTRSPFVSHPRELREIPIEVKDGDDSPGRAGNTPVIEEVTETGHLGPEIRGTVVIDDEYAEDVSNIPFMDASRIRRRGSSSRLRPNPIVDAPDDKDIEEAMIQAAIEASKWDATMSKQQSDNNLEETTHPTQTHPEDADFAHAVSLSLQTAQKEKDTQLKIKASEKEAEKFDGAENLRSVTASNGSRQSQLEVGGSSIQDETEDVDDAPMVRIHIRHASTGLVEAEKNLEQVEISPTSSPPQPSNVLHSQGDRNNFPTDEWGGISSEEHDEAVMLEAAMFGGIPEGTGYHFPYAPHQFMQNGVDSSARSFLGSIPRPPSPSLTAQRMIREQQDDEYLASLQADREKELKAKEDAEAVLAEKRLKENEGRRQLQEEEELERQLAAKEASLPQEPVLDDENAVTLLVRMPDGSRRGRRFYKSDKLQHLFDFIDVGRGIKPNSYRLVMPYPRRAFCNAEGSSTLDELGLRTKQEALYLETI